MANQITQEELIAAMQSGGASTGLLQAMQARLSGLVGRPSGLIETLPKPVQKRIAYLKTLQGEYDELEGEFEKEVEKLQKKYAALQAPILTKRAAVVKGETEAPADIQLTSTEGDETGPAGIPEFWLGVLRANEVTGSQISEKDEGVLEYLVDVSTEELEDGNSFKINFEFAENPYFENKILTKTYHMVEADEPVLEKATGTAIEWKAGKNVTVKVMKKKPKPGRGGKSNAKPITKTEPVDSFFSFFSPPEVPEDEDELDEEEMEALQTALEEDYELGETIRDELIPNAVKWYTGEIGNEEEEDEDDDDDDEDEEDDEGDEEDEEEDEDEEDADDTPQPASKRKGAAKLPADAKEQPPECKQQ